MLTEPQPTIHPDGTPEWGTLRPGDDLVQVDANGVTIISDVDRLDSLALILDPEYRQGRGHDCRWTWTNGEIIITGTCDVYGNGMPAMWCRPEEWWVTADGEEYEP